MAAFWEKSYVNGPGCRTVIWVQGCDRRCRCCFNIEMQSFVSREIIEVDDLVKRITAQTGIEGVTFCGGEPFEQAEALAELAEKLRVLGYSVVLFTGYTLEELKNANRLDWNRLLINIDLLIDGPFELKLRSDLLWRGSSNQRLIYLTDRLKKNLVEDFLGKVELKIVSDGQVVLSGFPDFDMKELSKRLEKFGINLD